MKHLNTLLVFVITAVLSTGCDNKVSQKELNTNMATANENSSYNAKTWKALHPEVSDFVIEAKGDSTQSKECLQGDGWATIDLVKITKDNREVVILKCSTISAQIGCRTKTDYDTTAAYANQANKCNSAIDVPLEKIAE
jgi:hypothetical protein